ncbi:MAG: four helix bundle protein [Candidatus Moranbacteria bacterium]|nr:four helix bundle protein [Candidatus Moranbacteria bacterium]
MPKKDRFGIHAKIEQLCLDSLVLVIKSALSKKEGKILLLESLRVDIETMKNLVRLEEEIKIIKESKYLMLSAELLEVSKMANGWLKYLENNQGEF